MRSLGTILVCTTLLFVGTTTPARADDASKMAKVEELFRVMRMDEMVPRMTQQIMAQSMPMVMDAAKKMNLPPASTPKVQEMQAKMMPLIMERMSWEKMRPVFVKVYADTFTEDEVGGIVSFYQSPAGQAYLEKTPLLTQNTMKATQGMMGDMLSDLPRLIDEMMKKSDPK